MHVEVQIGSNSQQKKVIRIDDGFLAGHQKELEAAGAAGVRPVRLAYAALHVVMKPEYRACGHSLEKPGSQEEIAEFVDWETTLRFRRTIADLGFGIAEAMDTAQRFFLGWKAAERLIRECGRLNLSPGFIAGAGTDHLESIPDKKTLIDGVVDQARLIQEAGGVVILLPMPWLTRNRASEAEYVEVYGEIIRNISGPVYLHWLGEVFMASLRGYFPGESFESIMALDPEKVRGAKISLLDGDFEIQLRRKLMERDQIILTGDDFHFARLIRGGDQLNDEHVAPKVERWTKVGGSDCALGNFSHALLGAFDGIAGVAGPALKYLAVGRPERYLELMLPAEELSRAIFEAPTEHYKGGLAFLAWLNGCQDNFMLVNRQEKARSREHYLRLAELGARAGALTNARLAAQRIAELQESWEVP